MEQQSTATLKNRLSKNISSVSLDKGQLKVLCEKLQERADSAAELEVMNLKKDAQQSDEKFEEYKKLIRESFKLYITITGKKNEELVGHIDEVFDSPNFPEDVKSLYLNSELKLKAYYNYYPRNSFELYLDFRKPKIFDLTFQPSNKTPNNSNLIVQGYDPTWASGVFSEIVKFIDEKAATLSFVHNHSIYDVFHWLLGIPLSFWVCSKVSGVIELVFQRLPTLVMNASYLYVFFISLFIFRILFHYLRWVIPLIEYRNPRNKVFVHRTFLGALYTGILCAFIYDMIKNTFF